MLVPQTVYWAVVYRGGSMDGKALAELCSSTGTAHSAVPVRWLYFPWNTLGKHGDAVNTHTQIGGIL